MCTKSEIEKLKVQFNGLTASQKIDNENLQAKNNELKDSLVKLEQNSQEKIAMIEKKSEELLAKVGIVSQEKIAMIEMECLEKMADAMHNIQIEKNLVTQYEYEMTALQSQFECGEKEVKKLQITNIELQQQITEIKEDSAEKLAKLNKDSLEQIVMLESKSQELTAKVERESQQNIAVIEHDFKEKIDELMNTIQVEKNFAEQYKNDMETLKIELNDQIDSKKKHNEHLKAGNTELQARLNKLEIESQEKIAYHMDSVKLQMNLVSQFQADIENLKIQMNEQVGQEKKEKEHLQSEKNALQTKIAKLEESEEQHAKLNRDSQEKIAKLEIILQEKTTMFAQDLQELKAKSEIDSKEKTAELELHFQEKVLQLERDYQNQIDKLQKESQQKLVKLEMDSQEKLDMILLERNLAKKYKGELDKLRTQLNDQIESEHKIVQKLTDALEESASLKKDCEDTTKDLSQLKRLNTSLKELNDRLEANATIMTAEKAKLSEQLLIFEQKLEILQKENLALQKNEHLQAENTELQEKIVQLEINSRKNLERLLKDSQESNEQQIITLQSNLLEKEKLYQKDRQLCNKLQKDFDEKMNEAKILGAKLVKERELTQKLNKEKQNVEEELKQGDIKIKEIRLEMEGKLDKMKKKMVSYSFLYNKASLCSASSMRLLF